MPINSRGHRRRLGEILLEEGLITVEQLDKALQYQEKSGQLLGEILRDLGLVTESDIAKIVCVQLLPFLDLINYSYDETLVELFDKEFLHRHTLLPFDKIGNSLLVLVTEIPAEETLAEIPNRTGLNAALYVGYTSQVVAELDRLIPLPKDKKQPPPPLPVTRTEDPQENSEDSVGEKGVLFSNDSESLLEELDSTWNSIFNQLEATTDDDEGADDKIDQPAAPAASKEEDDS